MDATCTIMPERDDCAHPLAVIEHYHARLFALCATLETIADTLPRPAAGCAAVASELATLLPVHHADEERGLFAILRRKCAGGRQDEIVEVLDQLSADHAEDDASLMEIVEYIDLLDSAETRQRMSVEAVGYAIRGFFQAKRRHLSLETNIIMPFARKTLVEDDIAALETIMRDNRERQCTGDCADCKAKLTIALEPVDAAAEEAVKQL